MQAVERVVRERTAAVANLVFLVIVFTVLFIGGIWLTSPHGNGIGGAVAGMAFAFALRWEGEQRVASGLVPRWDGLRDLGRRREVLAWCVIVTGTFFVECLITQTFVPPVWSALVVSAFLGTVVGAGLWIRRHFHPEPPVASGDETSASVGSQT